MTTVLTTRKTGKTPAALFLPYQLAWINDGASRKLGDKSRRTGWTWSEAFDALSRRFRRTQPRDCDYWFSSADESAAAEFIEYCRWFAQDIFGAVADHYVEQVEDPETRRSATAFAIRCPNGRKIVAMSSNPRRFRSKGGDVCLDEFAFHDDPRAMYTAAAPVTTWGGSLRVFSTHNGENNEFNRLVKNCRRVLGEVERRGLPADWESVQLVARELRVTPAFSYHRVTIEDAVAQGLVETMNRTRGTTWTPEAFLADCREKCIDEESYLQEYLCVPGTDASALLPYEVIERCEDDDCPALDVFLGAQYDPSGAPCLVGVDVGRKRDLTVVWALQPSGDVLRTRAVWGVRDTSLPLQREMIGTLLRAIQWSNCNIDMTGIGLGLYEELRREFGARVHGVNFAATVPSAVAVPGERGATIPVQHALAIGLKQRFEDRALRIPSDPTLRQELHKVRKTVTPGGRVSYSAERGPDGHADYFWALALAVEGAAGGGSPWLEVA